MVLKLAGEHKPTLLTLAALITFPEWTKETHHGPMGIFTLGDICLMFPKGQGDGIDFIYIYIHVFNAY